LCVFFKKKKKEKGVVGSAPQNRFSIGAKVRLFTEKILSHVVGKVQTACL